MPEYVQRPDDRQHQIACVIAKRTGWVRGVTSNMARDLVALIESWRITCTEPCCGGPSPEDTQEGYCATRIERPRDAISLLWPDMADEGIDHVAPPLAEDPLAVGLGLAEAANDEIRKRADQLLARVEALEQAVGMERLLAAIDHPEQRTDEPVQPRQWHTDDPEPEGVRMVIDRSGYRRWCRSSTDSVWYARDVASAHLTWADLVELNGPLTEVITKPDVWTWRAGDRIEWNPTGDVWLPGEAASLSRTAGQITIRLDDGERLTVEQRHLRVGVPTEQGDRDA